MNTTENLVEQTKEVAHPDYLQKVGELNQAVRDLKETVKGVHDKMEGQERLLKLYADAEKEREKNRQVVTYTGPPVTYKKNFAELWAKGPDPRNEWELEVFDTAVKVKMLHDVAISCPEWGFADGYDKSPDAMRSKWDMSRKLDALLMKATFWDPSSATAGGNWVPTLYQATPIDFYQLTPRVAGIFGVEIIPEGTNTLRLPVGTSATVFDSVAYATSVNTAYMAASPGQPDTNYIELVAKRNRGIINMDRSETEDAFISALDYARRAMARDAGITIDETLINGQSDTTLDGAANGAPASRSLFDGLRYYSILTASSTVDATGLTIDPDDLMALRKTASSFAVYPDEGVFIMSPISYFNLQATASAGTGASFTTVEKYGPQATLVTGELARAWGHAVVVSDRVPINLATTGRRNVATGSTTCVLYVNRTRWMRGTKRNITIEMITHAAVDQVGLVAWMRHGFDSAPPTTDKHTVALINVPIT